nr:hypothetical protein [uncultured Cetobacterium sp.]
MEDNKILKNIKIFFMIFFCFFSLKTYSLVVPANTDIGNQAILKFTNAGGEDQEIVSNIVITRVQQIYLATIDPDRSMKILSGKKAIFSHIVTNRGNGQDSVSISHDYPDEYVVKFYLDINKNGVLDSSEEIEITSLNNLDVGEERYILVSVQTPINKTSTVVNSVLVTSLGDTSKIDSALETIIYAEYAEVKAIKSLSPQSGEASIDKEVTFYIKIYNEKETTSPDFELKDILDNKFKYVIGSAKWYPFGSTSGISLTDANGGDVNGINYTVLENEITLAIDEIPGNTTDSSDGGYLEFKVIVPAGTAGGKIENSAMFDYSNGVSNVLDEETNTVVYEVLSFISLTFTGDTIEQAAPGETITFINTLRNTGNSDETFNITLGLGNSNFPVNTKNTYKLLKLERVQGEIIDDPDAEAVVQILESNEVSNLTDTNGDGILDTGMVKAGESIHILLQMTLEETIESSVYTIDKFATSSTTPNIKATATDKLLTILPTTVDLTNDISIFDDPNAPGAGKGPENIPVTTLSTTGVQDDESERTLIYTLYVNNLNEFATENYDLLASSDKYISNPVLTSLNVTFTDESGNEITNTGDIGPNESKKIYMKVIVEKFTYVQEIDVYVQVKSTITGASDIKYEKVVITPYRQIVLSPDFQSGVVIPGGEIAYKVYITNLGNIVEAGRQLSPLTFYTENSLGFASALHYDRDKNGEYTPGYDGYIAYPFANKLDPGETEYRFLVVKAPKTANRGDINITTVGATSPPKYDVELIINTIQAETKIITEELIVEKMQSLDGENYTKGLQSSSPGEVIYYRIETTNVGEASAQSVYIEDEVPIYTTLENITGSSTPGPKGIPSYSKIDKNGNGSDTYYKVQDIPRLGTRGTLRAEIGELKPDERAVMYFHVRINN